MDRKDDGQLDNPNYLPIHQGSRSAIHGSQQPKPPIGFLFLKLPPPPCAVLLDIYTYITLIYIYIYIDALISICIHIYIYIHINICVYIYFYVYILNKYCFSYENDPGPWHILKLILENNMRTAGTWAPGERRGSEGSEGSEGSAGVLGRQFLGLGMSSSQKYS